MKTRLKAAQWLIWAGAITLLIVDSSTSFSGCQAGLELCIKSVIPALFPFLVLSPLFTQAMCGRRWKLLGPLLRWLRLPHGSEALVITGCLGGYPVGAQSIAQAFRSGQLSARDARRMLAFCCNCGPGFLFGICAGCFSSPLAPWLLWLCHLVAAAAVGRILPGDPSTGGNSLQPNKITVTDALSQAVKTMGQICGWVMVFRLLLAFGEKYLFSGLPASVQVLIGGLLELTNGCCRLRDIASESIRFVICQALLSFGGICVAMQTASVTAPLGIGSYLPGKLLQGIFSGLLAGTVCCAGSRNGPWAAACAGAFIGIFLFCRSILEKKQKMSGNPKLVGV